MVLELYYGLVNSYSGKDMLEVRYVDEETYESKHLYEQEKPYSRMSATRAVRLPISCLRGHAINTRKIVPFSCEVGWAGTMEGEDKGLWA